jgi:hypothetical protein
VRESTGLYPRVRTDGAGSGVVSHAGAATTDAVKVRVLGIGSSAR